MKWRFLTALESFVDGAIKLLVDVVGEFLGEVVSSAIGGLFS